VQFWLQFLCGQGWWAFLQVFTGHLRCFSELCVLFICPFICWAVDSLWGCLHPSFQYFKRRE
jgi:hypothetical protein